MANLKRTREDVLSSVLELIHQQGFHSTGLKELLAVSGTSSGSFYNYFQSKDELAHALIDFKWSSLKATLFKPSAATANDAITQMFEVIDILETIHLAEKPCAGCFLGNLIVELVEYDPSFREHLIHIFDEWQEEIARLLRVGQDRLQPEVNPNILAQQLLTAIEGALLLGRLYNNPEHLKRGFDTVRYLLISVLV
ncbi:MAG: TetR/AcrR family transcriptional regulator [Chroococcidiopsidaceae cyanobacterium CP_BM_ER_R8_30]|nr:TetR/AcrR family transcriptional regulator [Chroococcidiopsidaceae cyanobacterium CP_BM_ER_R8_30]